MKLYEMAQKLSMLVSLQEFLYDQSASTIGSDKRTKSVIALISDCSNDVKNRGGKQSVAYDGACGTNRRSASRISRCSCLGPFSADTATLKAGVLLVQLFKFNEGSW